MQLIQNFMMRNISRTIWIFILIASPVLAFNGPKIPVRHLVGTHDTPYSHMTGNICPYVYSTATGSFCGLNQETSGDAARVELGVIGKFDERAYDDFTQLERKPSEDLVQRIFAEQKFNSASGIVSLGSYFRRSHIIFTPVRYVQTYFVTNPVSPEVHYVRAIDSLFSLQHTFQFETGKLSQGFRNGEFLVSVMPWMAKRERSYLDADLSDLLVRQTTRKKASSTHQDINVVVRYVPGTPWLRGITLSGKNLNGGKQCASCGDALLDIDLDSRRVYQASVDLGGSFPVGGFLLGVGVESQVEEEAKTPMRFNFAAAYKLTSFGFYGSINETITRFGFLYEGDLYRSGIIYTNEKQVNTLRFERKNEAFLVFGVTL